MGVDCSAFELQLVVHGGVAGIIQFNFPIQSDLSCINLLSFFSNLGLTVGKWIVLLFITAVNFKGAVCSKLIIVKLILLLWHN